MTIDFEELVEQFFEDMKVKYPPKEKPKEKQRRSRFDHMSPERYEYWKEEHQ